MTAVPALDAATLAALMRAEHDDPYAVLGLHADGDGWVIRALLPGAGAVSACRSDDDAPIAALQRQGTSDLFAARVVGPRQRFAYRLRVQWAGGDAGHSLFVFQRRADDGSVVLVISNFTPVVRRNWRFGVPAAGRWREIINTDLAVYGGSGVANAPQDSEAFACDGHPQSLHVDLPPLATLMWAFEKPPVAP